MKQFTSLSFPVLVLALLALGCAQGPPRQSSPPTPFTEPEQPKLSEKITFPLEYTHRWNWSESGNYFHIEGEITNLSGRKLDGVRIVLSFYDKQQNFVTSDISYPEFDPLMPGQTSPYTSMIAKNPVIDTYRVEFATRDGSTLPATEKVKPIQKRKK